MIDEEEKTDIEFRVESLETKIKKLTPRYKPGWKSISSWFCLLLVIGLLYFVWLWYQKETGHRVWLPDWML